MDSVGRLFDFLQTAGRGGEGHPRGRSEITSIKGTHSLGNVL